MRPRAAVLLALFFAGLVPASVQASAYTSVLDAYQKYGSVPACQFTSAQLASALKGVDAYGQQYFADFSDAVQAALAARAAGACIHGARRTLATGASLPAAPLPRSVTSATASGVPLPVLLMAVLGAGLALGAGAGVVARGIGWYPSWAAAWRHAFSEAGFRSAGVLAEVTDWVRTRRFTRSR